jgi:ABC-type bacteriocin/lantibiotic exporter with double-glycine peptidase domain
MSSTFLQIDHIQQRADGECMAACAAMILSYINVRVNYNQLINLLHITPIGTASFRVLELEKLNITVVYKQGTLDELREHLANNRPCLAFVDSAQLPYSRLASNHAVVVSGMDETQIYLNDPDLDYAPVAIPIGDFDLAWLERDEYYAAFLKR